MTENFFTLWDAHMGTVNVLERAHHAGRIRRQLHHHRGRRAANGRPNHVRDFGRGARVLHRDVLLDWGRDDPNHVECNDSRPIGHAGTLAR